MLAASKDELKTLVQEEKGQFSLTQPYARMMKSGRYAIVVNENAQNAVDAARQSIVHHQLN